MSEGWKLAFWIVAASLLFIEAFRGVVWGSDRVPNLAYLGLVAFVVPFAWDVGAA